MEQIKQVFTSIEIKKANSFFMDAVNSKIFKLHLRSNACMLLLDLCPLPDSVNNFLISTVT